MASIVASMTLFAAWACPQSPPQSQADRADALVRQLREFRAALPPAPRSDGSRDPVEERRDRIYAELREIGGEALPALSRGLADPDVQIRRNAALFLIVAGGSWYHRSPQPPPLNIEAALLALTRALAAADVRVRQLAAGAIENIGPAAASAVPALIDLLRNPDEGSRNTACTALGAIGPAAQAALPALRVALSDPSADVRGFARRAIDKIDK